MFNLQRYSIIYYSFIYLSPSQSMHEQKRIKYYIIAIFSNLFSRYHVYKHSFIYFYKIKNVFQ